MSRHRPPPGGNGDCGLPELRTRRDAGFSCPILVSGALRRGWRR